MEAFHWDTHFETGLDSVDDQHRHLVDSINLFGEKISANQLSEQDLGELLGGLKDYALFHFEEEERFMIDSGLDQRHLDHHFKAHRMFLDDVQRLSNSDPNSSPQSSRDLLAFLSHWLAFHILGEDQFMARQIRYINQGMTPAQAFEKGILQSHEALGPLLEALNGLFEQVSRRNEELQHLNNNLEKLVQQRTMELQHAVKELEELALTDVLTGLPNRRHAMRMLSILWDEAIAAAKPLSCMMIDADHFKEINDGYGHDCGDRVLKELAIMLKNSVRTDDVVARLGGDEFFIICPNTGVEGAAIVAEQLLGAVNGLTVTTGEGEWQGSISVGVAVRDRSMDNYDAFIKAADEGVYRAKRDGKNCIRYQS
ncbi:GGDEF domain-containing protein [Motiliproteus sp.]|uniref:GGDEF domain-containing protein n=1 Tax=Motiliproteus sp. TaxID=1898955 RepID=UPI003BA98CF1